MNSPTYDCVVKFDGAGFWTNTVKGKRATCTWSDRAAAQRLADRIFGVGLGLISQLPSQPNDHEKRIESRWKLSSSDLQENENA
ncbi:hypothetical protein [Pseudomonas lopnurensis]|uniref:hypothetical protein n=1 Tax=Pseudomonas lopnurensis TaxID=1477517 RepID=UPI0028AB7C4A|nr:hypothetical protein [Pseudomonas lopnurensis]